jgi:hypothetical protein
MVIIREKANPAVRPAQRSAHRHPGCGTAPRLLAMVGLAPEQREGAVELFHEE